MTKNLWTGFTTRILEAVYEGGVLRPLEDAGLAEHQRVLLEIRTEPHEHASSLLAAWHRVYEELPEEEIAEVEAMALDRSHFSALTSQAGASSDEVRRFPPRSERVFRESGDLPGAAPPAPFGPTDRENGAQG